MIDEIVSQLRSDRLNAETVFYKVIQRYIESLRTLDDPYLSERAIDIEDVARRIMTNLYETDDEAA